MTGIETPRYCAEQPGSGMQRIGNDRIGLAMKSYFQKVFKEEIKNMVISKNLKEYAERTIYNKLSNANAEIWEKKQKIFDTIRDELNSIQAKAVEKCIKIIEEKGLIPEDFGYHPYGDGGFPTVLPYRARRYVNHLDAQNAVQEILLKIELDEIPKNEVKNYIDNYDVSKFLEK